jgi:hypothetical protein
MECTSELQTTQQIETSELIENKEIIRSTQSDRYDEDARKYRKYMAEQEAFHQFERIKTNALVTFRR